MKEHFITIAIQTTNRANEIMERVRARGIDCKLEQAKWSGETKGGHVKVRVKLDDIENALAVTKEIDKELGAEVVDLPAEDIKIKKILIPVIFKSYSMNGAFSSLPVADKLGADIHLFHTYFNPFNNQVAYTEDLQTTGFFDTNVQNILEEATKKMENLVDSLNEECREQGLHRLSIHHTVTGGNLLKELGNKSAAYHPDLLVIGTRGADKKSDDIVGSFTSRVIKQFNVPVLAIPEEADNFPLEGLKILYVTRFDDSDFTALHQMISLTAPFFPRVHIVHMEDADGKSNGTKLNRMREFFDNHYKEVKISIESIRGQKKLSAIQDIIVQKDINMVSLNIHKTRFLSRLFSYGIEDKVLFHTNLPVLVFHF